MLDDGDTIDLDVIDHRRRASGDREDGAADDGGDDDAAVGEGGGHAGSFVPASCAALITASMCTISRCTWPTTVRMVAMGTSAPIASMMFWRILLYRICWLRPWETVAVMMDSSLSVRA